MELDGIQVRIRTQSPSTVIGQPSTKILLNEEIYLLIEASSGFAADLAV